MLPEGARVGVAVSGGADSVALLHALAEIAPGNLRAAVHVNHGLRGREADRDEELVRELARSLGCEVFVRREDVARSGGNVEQAGRRCRYAFFEELLDAGACDVIATGHTRSDQAETVLFRLLRGAGGAGLSGIWPVYRTRIVRPLLDVSRDEARAYLRSRGHCWREDASNADPAFARNRLRRDLLPRLRRDWNPRVEVALAHTADWAGEEERYWQERTGQLRRRCVQAAPEGLLLDVTAIRGLHPAEQRRLLDSILKLPELEAGSAGFGHIESLRELIRAEAGTGRVDLPGALAERSFGEILIRSRGAPDAPRYDLPLPVPGSAELPGRNEATLRTRLLPVPVAKTLYNTRGSALLDWDRLPRRLRLRNWQPGDRYRPAGQDSSKKIKELFQRNRVSTWMRAEWPVVTASSDGVGSGRIAWAREFGPAEEFALRPDSCRALVVDERSSAERNGVS